MFFEIFEDCSKMFGMWQRNHYVLLLPMAMRSWEVNLFTWSLSYQHMNCSKSKSKCPVIVKWATKSGQKGSHFKKKSDKHAILLYGEDASSTSSNTLWDMDTFPYNAVGQLSDDRTIFYDRQSLGLVNRISKRRQNTHADYGEWKLILEQHLSRVCACACA